MKKEFSIFFAALFILQYSFCQVSISGPTCATPGMTYQYNITGNWDSASSLKICVTGGSILNAGSNCQSSAPVAFVKIIWNETANGTISLSSNKGNANLIVIITDSLMPGKIDTISKTQIISYKDIPVGINCTVATGGNCTPSYSYQWQQSSNKLNWSNIASGTSQNLKFSAALKNPCFYRRRVIEQNSGTASYSNVLAIYMIPDSPTSK